MSSSYYKLIIDDRTPSTLSMGDLAKYLKALTRLLAEPARSHLVAIEEGCVALKIDIEEEAQEKVARRVSLPDGSAQKAMMSMDSLLRKHKTSGRLENGAKATVIAFPGHHKPMPPALPSITKDTRVEGRLIRLEGKDKTLHAGVLTRAGRSESAELSEALALRLRIHTFEQVAIWGEGVWSRDPEKGWQLDRLRAVDFEPLPSGGSFASDVAAMREITEPAADEIVTNFNWDKEA